MGLFHSLGSSRRDGSDDRAECARSLRVERDDIALTVPSRHEPHAFARRPVPIDPYAEWLAQRDREREREREEPIRWVYRYPGAAATRRGAPVLRARRAGRDEEPPRSPSRLVKV